MRVFYYHTSTVKAIFSKSCACWTVAGIRSGFIYTSIRAEVLRVLKTFIDVCNKEKGNIIGR